MMMMMMMMMTTMMMMIIMRMTVLIITKFKFDTKKIISSEYRKIPKISPWAYIFQRPCLRGLFLEGLIYGGKFAFHNRLGLPYIWKEIDRFCFILVCI